MKFIDEGKIFLTGGNGGNGCISFRREKFIPRGGPNGGDGGDGGSIYLIADERRSTLIDFQYQRHYKAPRGQHGRGKDQHGKNGTSLEIPVPPGTLVWDAETGELMADLAVADQRVLVAKGGHGGAGNARFTSSTRQAPDFAKPGGEGEERWLRLELNLLADVGLIGYPNVGKSTLISKISAARPKIASYPFTTLAPNLGVVRYHESTSFVVADIPGLIEGAHQGMGLGTRFLRHVKRTAFLVHILDLSPHTGRDPQEDYEKLNGELTAFGDPVKGKDQIVAANKLDTQGASERLSELRRTFDEQGLELYPVSALTGEGLEHLLGAIARKIEEKQKGNE